MKVKHLHGITHVGSVLVDDHRVAVVVLDKPDDPVGWTLEFRPGWRSRPQAHQADTMDQLCRLLMADVSKRLGRIEPVELWTTDHRGEAVTP